LAAVAEVDVDVKRSRRNVAVARNFIADVGTVEVWKELMA
jgi:hypothetical protein